MSLGLRAWQRIFGWLSSMASWALVAFAAVGALVLVVGVWLLVGALSSGSTEGVGGGLIVAMFGGLMLCIGYFAGAWVSDAAADHDSVVHDAIGASYRARDRERYHAGNLSIVLDTDAPIGGLSEAVQADDDARVVFSHDDADGRDAEDAQAQYEASHHSRR